MKNVSTTLIVAFAVAVSCSKGDCQNIQSAVEASVKDSKSLDELKSKLVNDLAFDFAATNRVELLKKLVVDLKSEKDPRDRNGSSLIHYAARGGASETLNWLAKSGLDIETTNIAGYSPMCVAAEHGQDAIVRSLFELGANLNGTLPGHSPAVIAAIKGHDSTLQLLLGLGADPDLTDVNGETPLHHVVRAGRVGSVKLLLSHGADATVANRKKQTPLSIAIKNQSEYGAENAQLRNWGTEQVFGPPNATFGDCTDAWASKTEDGQPEWLIVEFEDAVVPKSLEIYENYGPNAVNKITWFDEDGDEHEAWSGDDPATPNEKGMYVANINVDVPEKTNRFKIYIDSENVPNWNEIDAVGLVSDKGKQWVTWAEASSCYASGDFQGSKYRTIVRMLEYRNQSKDGKQKQNE
jgi:hypothetical protein